MTEQFEPRVGVFRKQAMDHLLNSETPTGGPIPQVVPFLWPAVGALTLAVLVFIGGLALAQSEDLAIGTGVLPGRAQTAPFAGQEWVVQVKEASMAGIQVGQLAKTAFGAGPATPEAPGVVIQVSSKGEAGADGGLVFPVRVRCTGEPNLPVPARDVALKVQITTRRRSMLAAFLGWGR